jgi:hypothetical protein
VTAIERDEERALARVDSVFQAGDILTFFSIERVSDELLERLTG